MFEVDIRYYDEQGHLNMVDLIYVHSKEEAQKKCDEISKQLGIKCELGAMIFVD